MAAFEVQWTGKYPTLCHGQWVIWKNGINVSYAIPNNKKKKPMDTAGTYWRWYFKEDWSDEIESYEDGLVEQEWIAANLWIDQICKTPQEKKQLFHLIAAEDWRHGSCGGCI